jgi:hypothetical protein
VVGGRPQHGHGVPHGRLLPVRVPFDADRLPGGLVLCHDRPVACQRLVHGRLLLSGALDVDHAGAVPARLVLSRGRRERRADAVRDRSVLRDRADEQLHAVLARLVLRERGPDGADHDVHGRVFLPGRLVVDHAGRVRRGLLLCVVASGSKLYAQISHHVFFLLFKPTSYLHHPCNSFLPASLPNLFLCSHALSACICLPFSRIDAPASVPHFSLCKPGTFFHTHPEALVLSRL